MPTGCSPRPRRWRGSASSVEPFGPGAVLVREVPRRSPAGASTALVQDVADALAEWGTAALARGAARRGPVTHGLPRLGARRPAPEARGDERAPARDGGDAALRPVQPRPPDLCRAEARRHRAAVRGRRRDAVAVAVHADGPPRRAAVFDGHGSAASGDRSAALPVLRRLSQSGAPAGAQLLRSDLRAENRAPRRTGCGSWARISGARSSCSVSQAMSRRLRRNYGWRVPDPARRLAPQDFHRQSADGCGRTPSRPVPRRVAAQCVARPAARLGRHRRRRALLRMDPLRRVASADERGELAHGDVHVCQASASCPDGSGWETRPYCGAKGFWNPPAREGAFGGWWAAR